MNLVIGDFQLCELLIFLTKIAFINGIVRG
jgi:hypothetical protein